MVHHRRLDGIPDYWLQTSQTSLLQSFAEWVKRSLSSRFHSAFHRDEQLHKVSMNGQIFSKNFHPLPSNNFFPCAFAPTYIYKNCVFCASLIFQVEIWESFTGSFTLRWRRMKCVCILNRTTFKEQYLNVWLPHVHSSLGNSICRIFQMKNSFVCMLWQLPHIPK